jgi:chromosomal replication initiation ATPase DnaA
MSTGYAQILSEIPAECLLEELARRMRAAEAPHPRGADWAMPVLTVVAEEFSRTVPELIDSRGRPLRQSLPRHFAMALLEHMQPTRSLREIGEIFEKGHDGVIHARKKIADLRDTEPAESLRWDRLISAAHTEASRRSARQVISAPAAPAAP